MPKDIAKITTVDNRFVVDSPFRLKDILKSIPGRTWKPKIKSWTYPISDRTAYNLRYAIITAGCEMEVDPIFTECEMRWLHGMAVMNDTDVEALPPLPTKPFVNQEKGLRLIRARSGQYLDWDMGTGKTKTGIDSVETIDGIRRVLIACPKPVIDVWVDQWPQHGQGATVVGLYKGTIKKRLKTIQAIFDADWKRERRIVCVINYESIWRDPFGPWVLMQAWDMAICDEIHRIKDPKGRASKFFAELAQYVPRRVGLSGTPMPNGPMDLFAQARFVEPGLFGPYYTVFRSKYAIMGGFENRQVVSYRNLEELKEQWATIAYRVTKEEILDLPEQVHTEIKVELCPKALKAYREIEASFVAMIDAGEVTVSNALVELLRLQQITGGAVTTDDGVTTEIDTSKRDALTDYFLSLWPYEAVTIFCRFRHDLATVHAAAKSAGRISCELSGKANELKLWQTGERDGVVDFKSQPTVLATQIQTGGLGVDMTRARYCVFYSLGFSLGDYLQALARTHRHGQTRKVTVTHLISRGTVDERIYAAISKKQTIVDAILIGYKGTP